MASENLVEWTTKSIIADMQARLPAALAAVRADRIDAAVTTEPPQNVDYFYYENLIAYKTPAVVVLPSEIDYRLPSGPNSVNALINMYVSCILEDRKAMNLQLKAFRYSDAIYSVLNRARYQDDVNKRVSIVKVVRTEYSRTTRRMLQGPEEDNPFRKEVMLTLNVEHYENET